MIIGISGKRGAGKDLLGGILVYHGIKRFSFAGSLKDEAKRLFNIGEEHVNGSLKEVPNEKLNNHTPRELMIDLGQFCRKFSKDGMFWVNWLYNNKLAQLPPDQMACITDVRFKNEANFIRNKGGIVVRLERKSDLNIYKGKIDDPSETELDDYKFDLLLPAEKNINPSSLEKFAYEVKSFAVEKFANNKSPHS